MNSNTHMSRALPAQVQPDTIRTSWVIETTLCEAQSLIAASTRLDRCPVSSFPHLFPKEWSCELAPRGLEGLLQAAVATTITGW